MWNRITCRRNVSIHNKLIFLVSGFISLFVVVIGSAAQILQKAEVKVINDTICNMVTEGQVTSRMMCSGYLSGGVDACQVKKTKITFSVSIRAVFLQMDK